eukprot:Gb_13960 [translate_table: standard]
METFYSPWVIVDVAVLWFHVDYVSYYRTFVYMHYVVVLELGMQIHEVIIKRGIVLDISMGNALITIYDKCGNIDEAQKVFGKLPTMDLARRLSKWNGTTSFDNDGLKEILLDHLDEYHEKSIEKMQDVQAKLQTPYISLSGQIKPGQTSDLRGGFATVVEAPRSLTPMLGDRKVEHLLGINKKGKPEGGTMGPPKKPKT